MRNSFSHQASLAIAVGLSAIASMVAPPPPQSFRETQGYSRPSYGRGHSGSKKGINVEWRRHKNRLARAARKINRRIKRGMRA